MAQTNKYKVSAEDEGTRLDRILKRIMPDVPVTAFQKFLRKKDIRLNDKKSDGKTKVVEGDVITFPEFIKKLGSDKPKKTDNNVSKKDEKFLKSLILYEDKYMLVINKPFGLAVQGGSGISRHLDGLLENLADKNGQKPHLVHRLDRDTSGVMVLAKDANSAAKLAKSFKDRSVKKIYWAIVEGVPPLDSGKIDLSIEKTNNSRLGEVMSTDDEGKKALTYYNVVSKAGTMASWVEALPLTGRKHQVRVHLSAIGNPIIGDGKYGAGKTATQIDNKLHLHARAIRIIGVNKQKIEVIAPLPDHIKKTFDVLGFEEEEAGDDPFANLVI